MAFLPVLFVASALFVAARGAQEALPTCTAAAAGVALGESRLPLDAVVSILGLIVICLVLAAAWCAWDGRATRAELEDLRRKSADDKKHTDDTLSELRAELAKQQEIFENFRAAVFHFLGNSPNQKENRDVPPELDFDQTQKFYSASSKEMQLKAHNRMQRNGLATIMGPGGSKVEARLLQMGKNNNAANIFEGIDGV